MGDDLSDEILSALIEKSRQVQNMAYCPYSKFHVGAALLCQDGTIFTGCNVENASYGLSMCAERGAIQTAVGQGYRKFRAIVISTPDLHNEFIAPCGACRQVLAEFGLDLVVYMLKPDNSYKKVNLHQILPSAFTPQHLTTHP